MQHGFSLDFFPSNFVGKKFTTIKGMVGSSREVFQIVFCVSENFLLPLFLYPICQVNLLA